MNNSHLIIRQATSKDAEKIAALGAEVFLESYDYPYNKEEMAIYLKETFSKKILLEEFKNNNITYFLAVLEDVVGFVKVQLNKRTWRFKGRLTFEVERLYIQKNMMGQNIGSRLMQTALEVAKKRGFRIIWLSVWESNKEAIHFHEKNGFVIIGKGIYTMGNSKQTYLVMQKI